MNGVGEIEGKQKIYVPVQDGGSSTIESRGTELDNLGLNCRTEEIEIITFDDMYSYIESPEVIDLIKIDCEGGEYGLLNSKELIKHLRNIRLELHVFNSSLIVKAHELINLLLKNKFVITNMSLAQAQDKINNCKCFEIYFKRIN